MNRGIINVNGELISKLLMLHGEIVSIHYDAAKDAAQIVYIPPNGEKTWTKDLELRVKDGEKAFEEFKGKIEEFIHRKRKETSSQIGSL